MLTFIKEFCCILTGDYFGQLKIINRQILEIEKDINFYKKILIVVIEI